MAANYYTSKYGTKINVTGLSGKPLNKIKGLADSRYGTKAQAMAQKQRTMIPKVSAPQTAVQEAVPPAATPAPNVTPINTQPLANATPPAQQQPSPGTVDTLFPSTRMFEPKNYEGSPLYKFQVQEGQKQLSKSLAARGLSNSGKAIEDELNIPLRAAAQDTDRMTRIASENADRLKSFQDNEALRQERAGNNQWDRTFSLAELMAQQSPWAGALAGLNNSANLTQDAGNAQANYLKEAYKKIIASGGGGGGGRGGGSAPVIPAGIDLSNIQKAQLQNQINNQNSQTNLWGNVLTQLPYGDIFKGIGSLF